MGQLVLRRLLSASDHASGCPELRPASANQPPVRRWHPGHIGLGFHIAWHVQVTRTAPRATCAWIAVWPDVRVRVRARVRARARVRVRVS